MNWKKALILLLVVLIGAAVVAANVWYRRDTGVRVAVEAIRTRSLEAIVAASGTVQPQRQVNVSANTTGRVTRLGVEEGQYVTSGQFLLEIDPRSLEGQLQRGEASVGAARSSLQSARMAVDQARANLDLARQNLGRQEELWADGLTTREALEQAQNAVTLRETDLSARVQDIETNEQRVIQEEASLSTTRYNLNQVIVTAEMDGLITRKSIEEGETAVLGTMNNPGSVLLTIADMSVLEAEVEVDETEIPGVEIGQVANVTIDAVPDRTFRGRVTEIGNSPVQESTSGTQRQATTFKVVITLEDEVPGVRPGFSCTAEITTATRAEAVSVPIQSLTVREMLFDQRGTLIHEPPSGRRRSVETTLNASNEPPPGHTREEVEGVFVVRDGVAVFTPVRIGIAGEQYFEVLGGLEPGDVVITGPYASVRELEDGGNVRPQEDEE